jgi:Ca2+-binding RTX toxin-like protein
LTVTSSALATTLGTVTADSINTTGVAGTLTAAFTPGIASAVFTGSTTAASYITGTGNNDLITTGSAADAIYIPALGTGVVNLTGGLGNDTYSFATTTLAGASITDTGGSADTLIFTGATSNTLTLNAGATFTAIGIDQIVVAAGVNTVAPGQIGAQTINLAGGGTAIFTLGSAGTLNLSTATFTAIPTASLPLTAAGVAVAGTAVGAVTALTLNGTSGNDVIVGSALPDTINAGNGTNSFTGGLGADAMTGGTGVDTFIFAAGDNGPATAAVADRVDAFTTTVDIIRGMGVAGSTAGEFTAVAGTSGSAYANALAAANVVFAATNNQSYFMTSYGTDGASAQGVLFLNLDNNATADGAILIGVAGNPANMAAATALVVAADILV